jgi:hypothetical protein
MCLGTPTLRGGHTSLGNPSPRLLVAGAVVCASHATPQPYAPVAWATTREAISLRSSFLGRVGMRAWYHGAMDWKDWCKLTGAILFFLIAIWRWTIYRRARSRH